MVRIHRTARRDRLPRMSCQNYPMNKGRRSRNAQTSSKSLEPVLSPNPRHHGCYSEPFLTMTSAKTSSCPLMSPILTCSTISTGINAAMPKGSRTSTSSSQNLISMSQKPQVIDPTKPALLDRLSDHHRPNQRKGTMNIQKGPAWTMMPCHGMTQKTQNTVHQAFRKQYRKPTLSSIISLGTPKERGRCCSIATDQSLSFHLPNGSTYSAAMPLISTTSSQMSIHYLTARAKSLNSERTSSSSMVHQLHPRQSKLMETGLLLGTTWSKPHFSFSNTEDQSYSAMEDTFSDTSHHFPLSSTTESSTTTEPSASEQLSAGTSTYQTSMSSPICRSNGSTTHQIPLSVIRQDLPIRNRRSPPEKKKRDVAVPPVEGGMKAVVPTLQPLATICTSAPGALTQVTSQAIATPWARNRRSHPSLRWEHRPRFVREYVWSDLQIRDVTTAMFSEAAPPLPQPPKNELTSTEKWEVIRTRSHLFKITTPIHVDHLHTLLLNHPNRPLVESVVKGLRFGFWPWAITNDSFFFFFFNVEL